MSDRLGPKAAALKNAVFGYGNQVESLSAESKQILSTRFGENYEPCASVACPAHAAGFPASGDHPSVVVPIIYDTIVAHRVRNGDIDVIDGDAIIDESTARSCWMDALAYAKRALEDSPTRFPMFRGEPVIPDTIEWGIETARQLGWLDPDDGYADIEAQPIPNWFSSFKLNRLDKDHVDQSYRSVPPESE